jgi:hypothetical protein
MLMAGLVIAGKGCVTVNFPHEPTTGADMEWRFVDERDGSYFRLLIQAKKATARGQSWRKHHYRELLRNAPTNQLQVDVLCDQASRMCATVPLYVFYRPERTCLGARAEGISMTGVGLADGFFVQELVRDAHSNAQRRSVRRVSTFSAKEFSLASLFCVRGSDDKQSSSGGGIPTPKQVWGRLADALARDSDVTRYYRARMWPIPEIGFGSVEEEAYGEAEERTSQRAAALVTFTIR